LNLRIKPKKRLKRDKPEPLAVPEGPNETWSIAARQAMQSIVERGFYGRPACGWAVDPDTERAG
tara:strand:+ start:603 stop:794 length:192 start_codon:yes stop_codon:yes gene_type:complete